MAVNKKVSLAVAGGKIKHELRTFIVLAVYLYVCFSAILLYKSAVLGAQGISFLPFGVPIIKALILAKFIMIGQMARLGDKLHARLLLVVAYKAALYLCVLIALSVAEEAVVALVHGRTITVALMELWGGRLWEILATSLIMLLILVPYTAVRELNEVVDGELWEIFSDYRSRP